MESKGTIFLVLGVFILIGLSFQPLKENLDKQRQNNSFNNNQSSIGSSNNTNYYSETDASSQIIEVENKIKKLEEDLDKKIEESKRSPYYGKIDLSWTVGIGSDDPNREYIALYTYLENNEKVNITGWYLKSEVTGYYAVIGKASLLPFPFTKTESNIVLQKGDRAYITKGFSPIGISFRTNMCTGYFEENTEFIPGLELACPRAIEEDLPTFSSVYDRNDECIRIIENIPRCKTRNGQFFRDLPDTVPSSCRSYIETNVNYNACVAKHFGDTKFPGNEYRIYLNKFGPLWRTSREKINLHDSSGLIVDTITIY